MKHDLAILIPDPFVTVLVIRMNGTSPYQYCCFECVDEVIF
jgi:hypothetical protein